MLVGQSTTVSVEVGNWARPQTKKLPNLGITPDPTGSIHKKTGEKKFARKKIIRKTLTFDKSAHL